MFSTFSNPTQAYKTVAVDMQVETASPHRLIVMLFEAAIFDVVKANEAFGRGDLNEMSKMLTHAIDIIANGLRASLDIEKGGEMAQRLDALYGYMCERLQHANLRGNKAIFEEIAALLGEIKSAWEEIARDPAVVSDGRKVA
jgi:flagellar protein FliS